MTRIFLIRHAEAEGNIYRRAHGHYNGQIIGKGHAQIELLRVRFEHEKIDAVYSSDLSRARTTAAAIYEPRGLQLETTEKLREVGMGVWEDIAWGDMEHIDPEMSKLFGKDPAKWRVDGSEEYIHVQKRMIEYIIEIARAHDGGTVAAFSHGFAIRALICGVLGLESYEIKKIPYCDNTAVTLLEYDDDELKLIYQGDNSHLDYESSTFAKQTWWRSDKAWGSENLRFSPLDQERDAELLELCRNEGGESKRADVEYTAFLINEPVGLVGVSFCAVNPLHSAACSSGWIECIYVKPEFRGLSFGVQLLGQALSVSRRANLEKLRIKMPHNSPAERFCQKYSFVVIEKSDSQRIMEKDIKI